MPLVLFTAAKVASVLVSGLSGFATSEPFLHLLEVNTTNSNRRLMGSRFVVLFFLSI
jgi:hypothetical protein